ncbi:MFS transporter [Corynebacterium uberis]|uniref:MFS transporter n=1 Tax=Corynebacterium TaxID=1716 RepID=UPI001D09D007|nr:MULTISPECIES: MFS transporter [Corynebacterium]MCZ9308937.1 MFS transporter [Corynebacterium sp. c6VSa_13]UDL74592.1 MFS transporter [Corynebacterium uberis]UDL76574.1 MFS transporter [Corynebacterium uberis]UDL78787.1 MFS transporter [Corynebacterium uberis]UDL81065.1 MFS transporter [Corynebacterium uberis]
MSNLRSPVLYLGLSLLLSGFGDCLIPIAFAIESTRLSPEGALLTWVLMALWAGRLVGATAARRMPDMLRPGRIMIIADVIRAVAQGGLLVSVSAGYMLPAAMVVSSAIYGLATSFFNPARFSLLPAICPQRSLGRANAVFSAIGDTFAIAGPVLGTLLMLSCGFSGVLFIDTLSFVLSTMVLLRFWATRSTSLGSRTAKSTSGALPRWVSWGLSSWFFVSCAVGLVGIAAPTHIMGFHGEAAWASVATGVAVGSLCGSALLLILRPSVSRWVGVHTIACVAFAAQIIAYAAIGTVWIVVAVAALGSLWVTVSGVCWDTVGQTLGGGDGDLVHIFATRDQLVNTVAIPCGMLVFALCSRLSGTQTSLWVGVALCTAGVASLFPLWGRWNAKTASHT